MGHLNEALQNVVLLACILLLNIPTSEQKRHRSCRTINAAFTLAEDGSTYFISGDEFIEYSFRYESESSVGPIKKLGLDSSLRSLDAAFTDNNGTVYFLKDCLFYRFQKSEHPGPVLNFDTQGSLTVLGLPCHVDAAINWAGDILVFKGCQVWRLNTLTSLFEMNGTTADRGGLPCQIDAAVVWGSVGAIFVKGTQFWKFVDSMVGPFHTDDLHICSWYLCGEADWMKKRRKNHKCNGDERFCGLRIDQFTLAGLHNAGSGFAGGFGFLNCLLRNHAENITRQLELGIRYLDIDPCHDSCGLLGTCHSFMCGGSICSIIKQVRSFLKDNREEIVTMNFNHEIKDPDKVFNQLNRQLQTQLGPMLNNRFRMSNEQKWPTLNKSIRTNKRVFIFYAPIIQERPYDKLYKRNKWIHNENFYGSTWRPFSVFNGCQEVVPLTAERCQARQTRELVEVSIVPQSGSCIFNMANTCRQYLHEALKACEPFRFIKQKSPNVLLVDYPEDNSHDVTSVFHAVYHQNVRNVISHMSRECYVKVDAAVHVPDTNTSLFFVGSKILVYNLIKKAQVDSKFVPELSKSNVDTAFIVPNTSKIRILSGCESWDIDALSLQLTVSERMQKSPCVHIDAAVVWQSKQYTFKECHVTIEGQEPIPLAEWGLPCHIDAVLHNEGNLIIFKGNNFWKYTGQGYSIQEGRTLDWTIDAVRCLP